MSKGLYETIYQTVMLIPSGRVATYGQIAAIVGKPRHARQVGYALSSLSNESREEAAQVPWHRVINAKGEVSERGNPDYKSYQRILLEEEGIEFGLYGRISLGKYQWQGPSESD